MKKTLSIILSVLMIVSCVPVIMASANDLIMPEITKIPTATEVAAAGDRLRTSTLSGGVAIDPTTGEEIAGEFSWQSSGKKVEASGYFEVYFIADDYETYFIPVSCFVYVRIIGDESEPEEDTNVYGSVIEWPEVNCSEWSYGLKVGDLTLTGGEATVDGTFVIRTDASTLVLPNKLNTVIIDFVPADSTVIMTGITSVQTHFTPKYTAKDFELTDPTKACTLEYGTALNGMAVISRFGIETNLPEGINANMRLISAVDESGNEVDINDRYLVPGTYTATATVYVPDVYVSGVGSITLYNPQNIEVTYVITKKTETSRFGSASLRSFDNGGAEVYLSYTAKAGANGYCVVKAGDDILLDNITREAAIVRIPAHKSGTYTLTFEYIPAENDYIEFETNVIEIGEVTFNLSSSGGGNDSTDCSHICHSENSLLQMLWKLISFFCQLFDIQQYCDCGITHYDAPLFG